MSSFRWKHTCIEKDIEIAPLLKVVTVCQRTRSV